MTTASTRHHRRYTFGAPAGLGWRAAGDAAADGLGSLSWRAPVFGVLSEDFGGWRELVLPSSVTRTMARPGQIAQYNHRTLLATRQGGTLDAVVDADGVRFTIAELPDTYVGQHVATMAQRGDLTGASFTFTRRAPSYWATLGELRANGIAGTPAGEIRVGDQDPDGDLSDELLVCCLTEIRIWESGPVDMPAYPEGVVEAARSAAALELHALRGINVDELRAAMVEHRLAELVGRGSPGTGAQDPPPPPPPAAGGPDARGMSIDVAREIARSRYAHL